MLERELYSWLFLCYDFFLLVSRISFSANLGCIIALNDALKDNDPFDSLFYLSNGIR